MKFIKIALLCVLFSTQFCVKGFGQESNNPIYHAPNVFQIMKKVADWQWVTLEKEGWKTSKKDWTSGTLYSGMIEMASLANDELYYKKLIQIGEDNNWKVGEHREEADDYCVGQLYSQLYSIYKNPRYVSDFKWLADSLVSLPHIESLEWKNKIDYREWAWCDALFMGPPAFAYLTQATGNRKYLDKASKLWWKTTDYLMDPQDYLYYRDSRFFNKKEKNGAKVYWSRGNGWVMGGLVKVLSIMDRSHPDSARFAQLLVKMSSKIASLQQPDGTWHASLLDPDSYPSKEISGTGFFCFALAWGINQNILSYEKYSPIVYKAWEAMVSSVHDNGKLGYVQAQGAAPDKVSYNDTDVYGVGAFLLAGKEMILLHAHSHKKILTIKIVNSGAETKNVTKMVSWKDISKKLKGVNHRNLMITDLCTKQKISFSINSDLKGRPISIAFSVKAQPGTTRLVSISKLKINENS